MYSDPVISRAIIESALQEYDSNSYLNAKMFEPKIVSKIRFFKERYWASRAHDERDEFRNASYQKELRELLNAIKSANSSFSTKHFVKAATTQTLLAKITTMVICCLPPEEIKSLLYNENKLQSAFSGLIAPEIIRCLEDPLPGDNSTAYSHSIIYACTYLSMFELLTEENRKTIASNGQYAHETAQAIVQLSKENLLADDTNREIILTGNGQYAQNIASAIVSLSKQFLSIDIYKTSITINNGQYAENIAKALVLLSRHNLLTEPNRQAILTSNGKHAEKIAGALMFLSEAGENEGGQLLTDEPANIAAITIGDGEYAILICNALIYFFEMKLLTDVNRAIITGNHGRNADVIHLILAFLACDPDKHSFYLFFDGIPFDYPDPYSIHNKFEPSILSKASQADFRQKVTQSVQRLNDPLHNYSSHYFIKLIDKISGEEGRLNLESLNMLLHKVCDLKVESKNLEQVFNRNIRPCMQDVLGDIDIFNLAKMTGKDPLFILDDIIYLSGVINETQLTQSLIKNTIALPCSVNTLVQLTVELQQGNVNHGILMQWMEGLNAILATSSPSEKNLHELKNILLISLLNNTPSEMNEIFEIIITESKNLQNNFSFLELNKKIQKVHDKEESNSANTMHAAFFQETNAMSQEKAQPVANSPLCNPKISMF